MFLAALLNRKVAFGFIARSFLEKIIWLFPRRCFGVFCNDDDDIRRSQFISSYSGR